MKSLKKKKRLITHNVKNKKIRSNLNSERRYIKKRTTLKNIHTLKQIGGDTPMSKIIKHINFFREDDKSIYGDIDEYLNPIYGVIMCESGYIENNYYLGKQRIEKSKDADKPVTQTRQPQHQEEKKEEETEEMSNSDLEEEEEEKEEEIDMSITPEMKFILKISTVVPPNVKPSKDIMQHFTPYIYGRYIAILYCYINLNDENINTFYKSIKPKNTIQRTDTLHTLSYTIYHQLTVELTAEIKEEKKEKVNFSKLFGNYLHVVKQPLPGEENVKPSKELFHILLYCLWWICDNMEGIKEYYRGMNVTFDRINQSTLEKKFPIVNIKTEQEEEGEEKEASFESTVGEIVYKPFKVINYGSSTRSFNGGEPGSVYSDCVETAMRNFVNLILYNSTKFNIDILIDNGANENTIKYYETFPSFDSQMSNVEKYIYGKKLDAKDAWSYLIINYANENIDFVKVHYEVNSGGLSRDKSKTNFIQLLQNLLSPAMITPENIKEKLPELNAFIKSVKDPSDAFNKGLGEIEIDYSSLESQNYIVKFGFGKGHSEATIKNPFKKKIDKKYIHNKYIVYLSGPGAFVNVNNENYLLFKYTPEDLLNAYYSRNKDNRFLELLSSELGNPDVRGKIKINANNVIKLKDKLRYINDRSVNDFVYVSVNFKFVYEIPQLRSLNHAFSQDIYFRQKKVIDLTPLTQLTSIGNKFMNKYEVYTPIDLSPLKNVTSIGNSFMNQCDCRSIDLSPLKNVTSIGHSFMIQCFFRSINLSPLKKLTSIGDEFMNQCGLHSINLSHLKNLTSIGNKFLFHCGNDFVGLKTIKIHDLPKLKKIGNGFATNCEQLQTIELSKLPSIIEIGNDFAHSSMNIKTIILKDIPKTLNIDDIKSKYKEKVKVIEKPLEWWSSTQKYPRTTYGYTRHLKTLKSKKE